MKLALRHQWLFARIELGLSKEEFNALTPSDFRVAVRLWSARETRKARREDELVARIAFFNNLSSVPRKEGDPRPSLTDFLPRYGKKKAKTREVLSSAQLLAKTRAIFGD